MQNFSTFLAASLINKIIKAHFTGLGSGIPEPVLEELKELKNKKLFLGNLPDNGFSGETVKFLDNFLTDVKEARRGGDASVYAEYFAEVLDSK